MEPPGHAVSWLACPVDFRRFGVYILIAVGGNHSGTGRSLSRVGTQFLPHFFYSTTRGTGSTPVPGEQGGLKMTAGDELERVLEDAVERLGFELVDLEKAGGRGRPVLRLRIDRPDSEPGSGVTVDDCARVSRALEEMLEAREDLPATYVLEVSSPGVERPIRKRRDFERFVGREIRVRGFAPLVEGSRQLTGILLGVEGADEDERIRLRLEDERELEVPRSAIAKARLVHRW